MTEMIEKITNAAFNQIRFPFEKLPKGVQRQIINELSFKDATEFSLVSKNQHKNKHLNILNALNKGFSIPQLFPNKEKFLSFIKDERISHLILNLNLNTNWPNLAHEGTYHIFAFCSAVKKSTGIGPLSNGKRIQSQKLAMGRVKIHFHTTTFKSMHNC